MAENLGKRARLDASITAALVRWRGPARWGLDDCLLALADIVQEALGYDPAASYRGRYRTMRGAERVTRRWHGFAGAVERAASVHGWEPIHPRRGRVGDIGIVANAKGARCGVIRYRRGLWVGRGRRGVNGVPTKQVAMAWRVK